MLEEIAGEESNHVRRDEEGLLLRQVLEQVIQKLHTELPNTTVYISSILPARDPAFERSKLWRQIPDFNVAIKAFCAEKEYPYVDNTEICEQYADLWQYDGIHVRQEFYAHWGANMIRAMRQYG